MTKEEQIMKFSVIAVELEEKLLGSFTEDQLKLYRAMDAAEQMASQLEWERNE